MKKERIFVIFAIGPVQSYIAHARRTQDLWAGSQLLSYLMQQALQGLPAEARAQNLLYPPLTDAKMEKGLPNQAVLLAPSPEVGQQWVGQMKEAVESAWQEVAQSVRQTFVKIIPQNEQAWQTIWDRQVVDWLEIYWVVWRSEEATYAKAFAEASMMVSARKQLRHIATQEESGLKSSLSGNREALRGEQTSLREVRRFWREVQQNEKVGGWQIGRGEYLDAIDTIKRFAARFKNEIDPQKFPSTRSIACADYRLALLEHWAELQDVLETFIHTVERLANGRRGILFKADHEPVPLLAEKAKEVKGEALLRLDGDFFYPDFYTESRWEELVGQNNINSNDARNLKRVADTLKAVYQATDALGIPRPSTYYALMVLDGDKMGEKLRRAKGKKEHKAFSKVVADFAIDDVPKIVGHRFVGAVVYAGGDDVFALFPTSEALLAANEVRQRFGMIFDNEELAWVHEGDASLPTASAGIAMVHHMYPLQTAVHQARTAEAQAKNEVGRNGFVVHRATRSGKPQIIGSKWELEGQVVVDRLEEVTHLIASKHLSAKFAYELLEEAPALLLVQDAWEAEIGRLLKRHTIKPFDKEQLASHLASWAKQEDVGIVALANWMVLAAFLGRGGEHG